MALFDAVAGVTPTEGAHLGCDLLQLRKRIHRECDRRNQLSALLLQIGAEQRPQRRVEREQVAVEELRGPLRDRVYLAPSRLNQRDLVRCHSEITLRRSAEIRVRPGASMRNEPPGPT